MFKKYLEPSMIIEEINFQDAILTSSIGGATIDPDNSPSVWDGVNDTF